MNETETEKAIELLRNGGIGVFATDTLYGIVGSALKEETVEKIYTLRRRDKDKPVIVLIPDIASLIEFDITLSADDARILEKLWPDKVSVIIPLLSDKFSYIHRGTKAIAFRIPKKESLLALLKETGPLVAPSANIQSENPAETISEAKEYFGDSVDFYLDEGKVSSDPSTVISLNNGTVSVIREGAVHIDDSFM